MSLVDYKILHVLSVALVLVALGALALHVYNGGDRSSNRGRKLTAICHGVGLVLLLVSGFGLLARLGVGHGEPWPAWVWIKLVLWALAGGLIALIPRLPRFAAFFFLLVPLLAGLAAWVALYKPFA